ncbi:MAG TPA: glycoside hydrolase family 28 protein [Puia sp.]|jgi:polygalacturonase
MKPGYFFLMAGRVLCFTGMILGLGLTVHAQFFDVTAFGAVGDGKTDNTFSIQRAIDSCAQKGGQVYFPAGKFLSATLHLKNRVTLYLSGGATLLGQPDPKKYPYLDAGIRFYGDAWARQSLIFCRDQENVAIEGSGTIDGQGAKFVVTTLKKPDRYRDRPYLLWFAGCRNVSVKGVQLRNSAYWMQHYLGCDGVKIDGINIWNHSNKNNDMMDIDGCRNVIVSNVTGDSDDDGITIKSTSPLISEYISITNCLISSHCNAIKFGTESTGGFRNVVISNCVIRPSAQHTTIYGRPAGMSGLALEVVDGGVMENISIDHILISGPQVPFFVRLGNRARKYKEGVAEPTAGSIKNIHLSNIVATGADETGCFLTGLPNAPLEDIFLNNISMETKGSDSVFDLNRPVEEMETAYPEGTMFGKLPAFGFFIRHAKGVNVSDISIHSLNRETRPGILVSNTSRFSLSGLDIQPHGQTKALVYIAHSSEGTVIPEAVFPAGRPFVLKDKYSEKITVGKIVNQ